MAAWTQVTVLDETGNPVKGVKLSVERDRFGIHEWLPPVYTDESGYAEVDIGAYPCSIAFHLHHPDYYGYDSPTYFSWGGDFRIVETVTIYETPVEDREAPRWEITGEYKSSVIGLPVMATKIKEAFEAEAVKRGCVLETFDITRSWRVGIDQHMRAVAILRGSPVSEMIILQILYVVAAAIIVFGIYLVGDFIVKPLAEKAPISLGLLALAAVLFVLPPAVKKVREIRRE